MNIRTEDETECPESRTNTDNEYKTTGQCSTGRILWLQGQCHESSQDITGSYGSWDDQAGEAGPVEL